MSEHVYKTIEVYGSSKKSIQDAVENAVAKTAETVRNLRWIQVTEIRGHVEGDQVAYWQIGVKIGFTIED